jgi:hypothetical protein
LVDEGQPRRGFVFEAAMPFYMSTSKSAQERVRGYASPPKPLPEYTALMAGFGVAFATFLALYRASGRALPPRIPSRDIVLLGLATHKLSRILARDKVTSPLRAPFTHYEKPAGASEVQEEPRGSSFRKVIGEMISCPYCLDVWLAATLECLRVAAPRVTRLAIGIFSAVAISDFLQQIYARLQARNQSA